MQLSEIFTQTPDQALGEIDGTQFEALSVVLVRTPEGASVYCLLREWGDQPASHLINQQIVIKSQQEQIELLNQQLQHALGEVRNVAFLKAENSRLNHEITQYLNQGPVNSRVALQRPITSIEDRIYHDSRNGQIDSPEVA